MIKKIQLVKEIKKSEVYTDCVRKALEQAVKSHGDQMRDDGSSVLEGHIYPITYSILKRYRGWDKLEELVILALLHDTMEDDKSFDKETCKSIFNDDICENVLKLTKRKKGGKKLSQLSKYFRNKKYIGDFDGANEVCKIVKVEDRLNNLQSITEVGLSTKNLRYVMETDTLFMDLAQEIHPFNYIPLLEKEIDRLSS